MGFGSRSLEPLQLRIMAWRMDEDGLFGLFFFLASMVFTTCFYGLGV